MRNRIQGNQETSPKPQKDLTEVKIKTLEEIRAEKQARNQQPNVDDVNPSESSYDSQCGNKRSASQGNRHIRIKRPKLADEASSSGTSREAVEPKIECEPEAAQASAPVPDNSAVQDEDLDGNYAEDEDAEADEEQAGAFNDEDLLLQIDNILGD